MSRNCRSLSLKLCFLGIKEKEKACILKEKQWHPEFKLGTWDCLHKWNRSWRKTKMCSLFLNCRDRASSAAAERNSAGRRSVLADSATPYTVACQLPVHEILQKGILQWVAMPFSREHSWPRDWTWVSCIAGRFFTIWAIREALSGSYALFSHPPGIL